MEKKAQGYLGKCQSSLATLSDKNVTLVCFCKQQSSEKQLSEKLDCGDNCMLGASVTIGSLSHEKKETFSYCRLPEVLQSNGRQVS